MQDQDTRKLTNYCNKYKKQIQLKKDLAKITKVLIKTPRSYGQSLKYLKLARHKMRSRGWKHPYKYDVGNWNSKYKPYNNEEIIELEREF